MTSKILSNTYSCEVNIMISISKMMILKLSKVKLPKVAEVFSFFFELESHSVARLECSGLISAHSTSASQVQVILVPQPPE